MNFSQPTLKVWIVGVVCDYESGFELWFGWCRRGCIYWVNRPRFQQVYSVKCPSSVQVFFNQLYWIPTFCKLFSQVIKMFNNKIFF